MVSFALSRRSCADSESARSCLASVDSSLHAKADEIRRALENACHRVSVQWSFEVSRGDVTRTTLRVSSEADLVIIGRQGLAQAAKVDLARKPRPKRPIVVAYDGTEAAKRALELASQLARTETRPITVVLANPGIEQADELRQGCEEACQMAGINVLLDTQLVSDATALCHAVHRWKGEILLINRDSPMLDENTIEALVNRLDSPIGLVR